MHLTASILLVLNQKIISVLFLLLDAMRYQARIFWYLSSEKNGTSKNKKLNLSNIATAYCQWPGGLILLGSLPVEFLATNPGKECARRRAISVMKS
jgi:hypothetical protein